MNRIICIGNRYLDGDAAGPLVYDLLRRQSLPDGVEIVDGGLAGLNLLPLLADPVRVVFVDALTGVAATEQVVVIEQARLLAECEAEGYGHSAGLPYLLRLRPQLYPDASPEILVVGVTGQPTENKLRQAATLAVRIARHGCQPPAAAIGGNAT